MIRLLLIEDEKKHQDAIIYQLGLVEERVLIIDVLNSVKATVDWFATNPPPDLVLMDATLRDGDAAQVFARTQLHAPVIFLMPPEKAVAACRNQMAIGYLSKPVSRKALNAAIGKYLCLQTHFLEHAE